MPLAVLSSLLSGCLGSGQTADVIPPVNLPDEVVDRFTLTETLSGEPEWTLRAPRALVSMGSSDILVTTPEVTIFGSDGRVSSVLSAMSGSMNRSTRDMTARGRVRVRSSEGIVVEAESLRWINATRRVYTGADVTIRKGGSVILGRGFESDAGLHSYKILDDLRAHVVESPGGASRE